MLELNSNRPTVARNVFQEGLHRFGNSSQLLLGAALCAVKLGNDDAARSLFETSVLSDRKPCPGVASMGCHGDTLQETLRPLRLYSNVGSKVHQSTGLCGIHTGKRCSATLFTRLQVGMTQALTKIFWVDYKQLRWKQGLVTAPTLECKFDSLDIDAPLLLSSSLMPPLSSRFQTYLPVE